MAKETNKEEIRKEEIRNYFFRDTWKSFLGIILIFTGAASFGISLAREKICFCIVSGVIVVVGTTFILKDFTKAED